MKERERERERERYLGIKSFPQQYMPIEEKALRSEFVRRQPGRLAVGGRYGQTAGEL